MADVVARGLRLHVQRLGEAAQDRPVVVFLHGLVMDNLSSWYFTVAPEVSRSAAVILYDLRGHGRSERPARGYRLDDHMEDLAALLSALAVERPVVLVGNSFGGLLALAFALARPDRVAGIALVDGHLGEEGFGARMAETLRLEGEARDRRIAQSFGRWLGRHSERKRTRLADNARALVEGTTLVADLEGTPALGAADLARLDVPILALYGERSDLIARAEPLLARAPGLEWVALPGCTHSVLWEATDEVRARLIAFVRARGGGR